MRYCKILHEALAYNFTTGLDTSDKGISPSLPFHSIPECDNSIFYSHFPILENAADANAFSRANTDGLGRS